MPFLKSQLQSIWEMFEEWGIDPAAIQYKHDDNYDSDTFVMPSGGYAFYVSHVQDAVADVEFHPAENQHTKRLRTYSWPETRAALVEWAAACQQEDEAIDPWSARRAVDVLLAEPGHSDGSDDHDEELFSPDQQASVLEALRALEAQINSRLDTLGVAVDEQKLYVARQFELLRENLPSKGRGKFRQLFRDVMVNMFATLTVSLGPTAAQDAIELANQVMHALPR